jgi:long-subunit fatty acid transport protein
MMSAVRRIAAVLLVAATLLTARAARASLVYTPNTFGLSARGMSLANALTGDEFDIAAAYYNPAAVAASDAQRLELGYIYTVPDLVGGLRGGKQTHEETNNRIAYIGTRVDFRRMFQRPDGIPPIGFGFNVAVDDNFFTMMAFDDLRSANGDFSRYGLTNLVMQGALGVGVTDWLSLGVGFHGGFRGKGQVDVIVDVNGQTANEGTKMRGSFHPAPLAGVFFHGPEWGLGLCYREETYGAFESIVVNAVPSLEGARLPEMQVPLNFLDTFVPREASVGASWAVIPELRVLADGSWREWSRYGELASDPKYVGSHADFDTVDTWTPRFGIEGTPLDGLKVRGGYRFEPTPFHTIGTRFPTTDRTIRAKAILDNDAHVMATGVGYALESRDVLTIGLRVDAAYQLHYLVPREAETSDHYTYKSRGWLHLFSAAVGVDF